LWYSVGWGDLVEGVKVGVVQQVVGRFHGGEEPTCSSRVGLKLNQRLQKQVAVHVVKSLRQVNLKEHGGHAVVAALLAQHLDAERGI
jgi:hypothetical protein